MEHLNRLPRATEMRSGEGVTVGAEPHTGKKVRRQGRKEGRSNEEVTQQVTEQRETTGGDQGRSQTQSKWNQNIKVRRWRR